jgi:hypothetical protein
MTLILDPKVAQWALGPPPVTSALLELDDEPMTALIPSASSSRAVALGGVVSNSIGEASERSRYALAEGPGSSSLGELSRRVVSAKDLGQTL